VEQGTRIGAVGMTGLATGPHLDYRMTRNGAFVDPLKIQSPPAEPVPDDERAEFSATRDKSLALLEEGKDASEPAGAEGPAGGRPLGAHGGQSP
jgi:hypothetical protein